MARGAVAEEARHVWLAAAAVVAAAVLAYGTTITGYFLQDDFGVVGLLSQKPASAFPRWFVSPWTDYIYGYTADEIRPFPALSYQLMALWGAASPVANHVLNIAIHAGNGVLVLALARVAGGLGVRAAALAALVFVVLPVQAESVAWITGRVDSMPAFFYLASFLAWALWRGGARRRAYAWSLGFFFLALFCKQNTITMVPALVLYDQIIRGGPPVELPRGRWRWPLPYLPFVALTLAYLALRYALFGEVAREDQLDAHSVELFRQLVATHLRRLLFGAATVTPRVMLTTSAIAAFWGASLWRLRALPAAAAPTGGGGAASDRSRLARVALYFGVAWTLLGIAPIAVAGYDSPRHMYLASVGWAMVVGLVYQVASTRAPRGWWRAAAAVTAAAMLALYAWQLATVVREWNRRGDLSRVAVAELERETASALDGTLVIASAPRSVWEWALPFAVRPPFTNDDATRRVTVISPWLLHCCRSDWEAFTRQALQAWTARTDRPPVVALSWDERTGALSRLTDSEDPALRSMMPLLLGTDTREALNEALMDVLRDLVGPHRVRRATSGAR